METIQNYLEMAFEKLPKTAELFRLKDEMAVSMEDKYNALKAEGKSENEAIGIVIAEFGNINEIAGELGIFSLEQPQQSALPEVSLQEAGQYIEASHRAGAFAAAGVMLCILGAAVLVGLTSLLPQPFAPLLGVVILLVMVAIAVGLFIFADSITKPWAYIKKEPFYLSPAAADDIRKQQEEGRQALTLYTIIAVVLYILGPIAIILSALLVNMGTVAEEMISLAVVILLCMVAVATWILIVANGKNEAYNALLQKEEYSPQGKKAERLTGAIAAFWWPATTALFLALGFLTSGGFSTAWVVWPVSGVLFAAVAGITSAISRKGD